MGDLLDRLAREMQESERAWAAADIARRHLKLTGSGPAGATLVRALLSKDPRFEETEPGVWEARSAPAPTLLAAPLLAVHFEGRELDRLRLHFGGWSPDGRDSDARALETADPSRWIGRAAELSRHRWVTAQPTLAARWLRRMDQLWALGEMESDPLDLQTWIRIALLEEGVAPTELREEGAPERLAPRWGLGPLSADGPGALAWMRACLDHLRERYPRWTQADLDRARDEKLESRPLDWTRFRFPESALAELPERPGTYRLLGDGDEVLYVGKSVNVARRLREHFRSLPPEPTRREEMLGHVRRFDYVELPSELEALLREHALIRESTPRWNVQVEIHPPRRFPADWRWPLVYVAPGTGPERSVVLLTGADAGFVFRLPARPEGSSAPVPVDPDLETWLAAAQAGERSSAAASPGGSVGSDPDRSSAPSLAGSARTTGGDAGGPSAPSGLLPLTAPQAWLALRYYVRFRDQLDRIDPLSCPGPGDLCRRILELTHVPSSLEAAREVR